MTGRLRTVSALGFVVGALVALTVPAGARPVAAEMQTERSAQAVDGDAAAAEQITREQAAHAAAEVLRLVEQSVPKLRATRL